MQIFCLTLLSASDMTTERKPFCKSLVLDAGPLLSLSPLRGIAEAYYTVPQVLAELKDKNAKEHLERLGLNFGIKIEVKNPDPASMVSGMYSFYQTESHDLLVQLFNGRRKPEIILFFHIRIYLFWL